MASEEYNYKDDESSSNSDDELDNFGTPLPDFMPLAMEIQNRATCRIGTDLMEARRFREFFGTSLVVVEQIWELLERESLLPDGCNPKHLLWALQFMKVYPKQSPGCSVVGGSGEAVDPKTHHKWVWMFLDAIAELSGEVVSI